MQQPAGYWEYLWRRLYSSQKVDICHFILSHFRMCRMAVSVLNYLRIHRVDQAEKTVRAMSALDDDATITQLATAWVNVFLVRSRHLIDCTCRAFGPRRPP